MTNPLFEHHLHLNRRTFLHRAAIGVGSLALGSLLGCDQNEKVTDFQNLSLLKLPHFAPKAKRVIYLFQSGASSQAAFKE
ncbi:MAG: twin-arginine translocation signal domain-containing protein [Haliscomenobacteraceae bacterium CHB4]|nr:twin-arginine translocation signal domain-containing protein [Haliscomenobacteraceae bacterium CHB4]